jgi:hypothetical protein
VNDEKQPNPAVAVVGIVAGVSLVIVVIFAIFARSSMGIAGWIVAMLALMGSIVAPIIGRRR